LIVEKVAGAQDEDLAHHIRVLLVPIHEPDHIATGRIFDHCREPIVHQLLKLHALLNDGLPAPTVEQGLLHPREASTHEADHQIILVVGLCVAGSMAVKVHEQRHHPIGDRRQHIAMCL